MNFCVCCARYSTCIPARSSRTATTPPEVPIPGMAGGGKPNAIPSGILASASFARIMMALTCSCADLRSSHDFRLTKKKPL